MDIRINSGLDTFVLLDRVSECTAESITGEVRLPGREAYLVMEALAQLGALHVRHQCGFEKHAFLLKVNRFDWTDPAEAEWEKEPCRLEGSRLVDTGSASVYDLSARSGERFLGRGEFAFAVIDYDREFKKEKLKNHYQGIFKCLSKNG